MASPPPQPEPPPSGHAPFAVFNRTANPAIKLLLRSPLHPLASGASDPSRAQPTASAASGVSPAKPGEGAKLGARLREGDRSAAPAALNLVDDRSQEAREQTGALLREVSPGALGGEAPAHLVG